MRGLRIVLGIFLAAGVEGVGVEVCRGEEARELLRGMKTDELVEKGEKVYGELARIIETGEKDPDYEAAMKVFPAVLEKTGRLTRVTVNLDDVKLSQAVEEVNGQNPWGKVGVNMNFANMPSSKVSIHGEKRSYNGAIWEICGKGNGTIADQGAIFELPGSGKRPSWESWGNLVILDAVSVSQEIDYSVKTREERVATASMQMFLDPCFKPVAGMGMKDIEAVDESGRKLKAVGTRNSDPSPIFGLIRGRAVELSAEAGTKKITKLSGKMMEFVGSGLETWTIEEGAKALGQSHPFGNIKVTVDEVTINGADVTVRISAYVPAFPELPGIDGATRNLLPFRTMEGSIGVEFEGSGSHNTMNAIWSPSGPAGEGMLGMGFRSNMRKASGGEAGNFKVKITFPRRFEEIVVGFEFKDVELP